MEKILRILIGILFLISSILKLTDIDDTIIYLRSITSFSAILIKIGLYVLIVLEAVTASAIFVYDFSNKILIDWVIILLSCFLIVSLIFLVNGNANCACLGVRISSSPIISIIKNILLLFTVIILKHKNRFVKIFL